MTSWKHVFSRGSEKRAKHVVQESELPQPVHLGSQASHCGELFTASRHAATGATHFVQPYIRLDFTNLGVGPAKKCGHNNMLSYV